MSQDRSPAPLYQLDGFVLDLTAGELRKNGERVPLQDLPLRLLGILVPNAGRLVAREEIQRRLWPDKEFADFEDGLNTAIKKLRHALDDDPKEPRLIETVRGRGYRLLVTVEMYTAPAPKLVHRPKAEVTAAVANIPAAPAGIARGDVVVRKYRWAGWLAVTALALGAWWLATR